jgi:hypothetical protein
VSAEPEELSTGRRPGSVRRDVLTTGTSLHHNLPGGTSRLADALAVIKDLPRPVADGLGAVLYGPYVVAALLTRERSAMPWDDIYAMVTPGLAFNMFFNTASVLRDPGPGRSFRASPRRPGGLPAVREAAS